MNAKSRGVRYTLFGVTSSTFLLLFASNAYFDWYDECLVQYATTATISATCFALYVSWWVRQGKATEVYAWLTVLLGTILVSALLTYQARWIFVSGDVEAYTDYISSTAWQWRQVPLTVVLLYMLALVIGRMVGSNHNGIAGANHNGAAGANHDDRGKGK